MKISGYLIVFILVSAYPMYVIAWDGLLEEIIQQENGMDNFCISMGYEKSTGYKSVGSSPIFTEGLQVECDKEEIFYWDMSEECVDIDKWGECHEEDYIVNLDALHSEGVKQ